MSSWCHSAVNYCDGVNFLGIVECRGADLEPGQGSHLSSLEPGQGSHLSSLEPGQGSHFSSLEPGQGSHFSSLDDAVRGG